VSEDLDDRGGDANGEDVVNVSIVVSEGDDLVVVGGLVAVVLGLVVVLDTAVGFCDVARGGGGGGDDDDDDVVVVVVVVVVVDSFEMDAEACWTS